MFKIVGVPHSPFHGSGFQVPQSTPEHFLNVSSCLNSTLLGAVVVVDVVVLVVVVIIYFQKKGKSMKRKSQIRCKAWQSMIHTKFSNT